MTEGTTGPAFTIPQSVAIIMDGNGRWAQERRRPRMLGHRAGAEAVDRITEAAARLGVRHLTLYAFPTENWQRPAEEVSMLWRLLVRDLRKRGPKCLRQGIRLTSVGRVDRIAAPVLKELRKVERETAGCEVMTLCLALDYGGTWDLKDAMRRAFELGREGNTSDQEFADLQLDQFLASGNVPPVDLLIRTGGDSRISNFLPWQLSYAELLFLPRLWPDFQEDDLIKAFQTFSTRQRRFGRIEEPAAEAVQPGHKP